MLRRVLIGVCVGTLLFLAPILYHNLTSAPSDSQSETKHEAEHSDTASGLTFHGYDCTVDCSGHEAGYQWAEQHGISDPDDCSGDSQSFVEGCRAYAKEQREPNDTQGDDDEPSD
jgi:hypothetical protein